MMLAGLLLLAGCAAETTSPTQGAAASSDVLGGVLGGVIGTVKAVLVPVVGLTRTTPLTADITVTQAIGNAGGTLSIPAAGVTVVVPAGAVSAPTQFTMTARAGFVIAYDFAPHGITFAKPLVFTQSLTGTSASLLNVSLLGLGYYADPNQLTLTGGLVSDLTAGVTDMVGWSFTAKIKHFSGYLVSCDRN